MGIIRDYIAFPFVMLGSFLYLIGEWISGKKFTRRADLVLLQAAAGNLNIGGMNRHERRALKHKIK